MASMFENLSRGVGTHNLKLELTGTVVSYDTYEGTAPTQLSPVFVRFGANSTSIITGTLGIGSVLDFGPASFGLPTDMNKLSVYIGVVKVGDNISLCVGSVESDGPFKTSSEATGFSDVVVPNLVTPESAPLWLGRIQGLNRVNGSWDTSSATLTQVR